MYMTCTMGLFIVPIQHNRAQVLSTLQEQKEQYDQWNDVVVDHMAEKEKQRLREEEEHRQRVAAVTVNHIVMLAPFTGSTHTKLWSVESANIVHDSLDIYITCGWSMYSQKNLAEYDTL